MNIIPASIGYVGGRFAATGAASYTLITAEGEVTNVTSENNMTTIPAGFEGWVVYPLSNATYRYDDGTSTEDGNTKEKLDPNRLLAVELQANAASTGAVWYLDDFCMTKQADDIVEALKKKKAKRIPLRISICTSARASARPMSAIRLTNWRLSARSAVKRIRPTSPTP